MARKAVLGCSVGLALSPYMCRSLSENAFHVMGGFAFFALRDAFGMRRLLSWPAILALGLNVPGLMRYALSFHGVELRQACPVLGPRSQDGFRSPSGPPTPVAVASAVGFVAICALHLAVSVDRDSHVVVGLRRIVHRFRVMTDAWGDDFESVVEGVLPHLAVVLFVLGYVWTYAGGRQGTTYTPHISFVFRRDKYGLPIVYALISLIAEILNRDMSFIDLPLSPYMTGFHPPATGTVVRSVTVRQALTERRHFTARIIVTCIKAIAIATVFSYHTSKGNKHHSQAHGIGMVTCAAMTAVDNFLELDWRWTNWHRSSHGNRRRFHLDGRLQADDDDDDVDAPVHGDDQHEEGHRFLRREAFSKTVRAQSALLLCQVTLAGVYTYFHLKAAASFPEKDQPHYPSRLTFGLNLQSILYETLLLSTTVVGLQKRFLDSVSVGGDLLGFGCFVVVHCGLTYGWSLTASTALGPLRAKK